VNAALKFVAFADDIVHPIWNRSVDVANLCSSVKQQLSAFTVIVDDGFSKSSLSRISFEVNFSAGDKEDLSWW
jgi:hypothetical protein